MSDGGLLFRQHIEPLPFAMRDWQVYLRQRNSKAAENTCAALDPARAELFGDLTFHERLAPEVSSIYLLEFQPGAHRPQAGRRDDQRDRPRVRSAHQAHVGVRAAALLHWDEITNLNAAYVVINAYTQGRWLSGHLHLLTQGKRVIFVRGIPQATEQYTGY